MHIIEIIYNMHALTIEIIKDHIMPAGHALANIRTQRY